MEKSTVLAALTFITLVSGMAVAAHQLWITEKAKKEGTGGPMLNRPTAETRNAASASSTAGTSSAETTPPPVVGGTDQRESSRADGRDASA